MSHTQRVSSNVSFINRFRRPAEERHDVIRCKAVITAQWQIVDALEALTVEEMKHAIRGAVELVDKNNGLMAEMSE